MVDRKGRNVSIEDQEDQRHFLNGDARKSNIKRYGMAVS